MAPDCQPCIPRKLDRRERSCGRPPSCCSTAQLIRPPVLDLKVVETVQSLTLLRPGRLWFQAGLSQTRTACQTPGGVLLHPLG